MTARPPLPRWLAAPLAAVYARIIALRNRRYDARRGVIELDRPTVSVGNLSVGGTGKTPMVMHALGVLAREGLRPCVAMRGYRSAHGESDEAGEYARAFPEVPVVAQPNRLEGLLALFGAERGRGVDAIVLDDGYQHRRIARDLDIVLIDATRDPFADALLPAGWLREPVLSLARAGAVVITHAEAAGAAALNQIESRVREINPGCVVAVCEHRWSALRVLDRGAERAEPVQFLAERMAVAACAIGNPGPFFATLRTALGRDPAGTLTLRDHDPFAPRTVTRLIELARAVSASAIVVTEKDWSKLKRVPADSWPCPVVRPTLSLGFVKGGEDLDALILGAVRARPYVPPEALLGPDASEEPSEVPGAA
jgi:tetraacyldisaccharide 4'-kinase